MNYIDSVKFLGFIKYYLEYEFNLEINVVIFFIINVGMYFE